MGIVRSARAIVTSTMRARRKRESKLQLVTSSHPQAATSSHPQASNPSALHHHHHHHHHRAASATSINSSSHNCKLLVPDSSSIQHSQGELIERPWPWRNEISNPTWHANLPRSLFPRPPTYKVTVCQLSGTSDKQSNIAHAKERIEAAAGNGAQLIVLPELWNCPFPHDSFPIYAEDIDAGGEASPSTAMLAEVSRTKKVTIVAGSILERNGGNLYNTCCVFGKNGDLLAKFRKIHLYDIDIPGKITFKESDTFTPGEELCVVDTDVGRIAVGICYDIRFPELAMLYAARGAHIICYPGAFNTTTGPLHWELLQKARAVDNQIFVLTCSLARDTEAGYIAWGHSTVVGPFGEILATTDHEEATIIADIDYSQLDTRRQNMPLESQRHSDLYHLTDATRAR